MTSADGRECSTVLAHTKIALSGKKTSTLYFSNPLQRNVEKVEVDGCAITDGMRCDWLLLLGDTLSNEEIYVELKGSDISHGVDQLKATILKLSVDKDCLPKRCFVVFNRNPMTGTDTQKHKVKFRRDFNAVFELVRDKTVVSL